MSKVMIVTVMLIVKDEADVQDVISEVDYSFNHPDIIKTEITDIIEPIG